MNFSTVPPWRSIADVARPRSSARARAGSSRGRAARRAPSSRSTSEKRTVTVLRCSRGSAAPRAPRRSVAEARPLAVLGTARRARCHGEQACTKAARGTIRPWRPSRHDDVHPGKELGDGVAMPVLGLGVWQMAEGARDRAGRRVGARGRLPAHRHGADVPQRAQRRRGARAQRRLPREEVFVTTKWLPHGARRRRASSSAASSGSGSTTSTCT